jgi:hypothetical protein
MDKTLKTSGQRDSDEFTTALRKIAKAGAASSRDAIEASKATKPSRHTRFVYTPAKGRA